MTVFQQIIDKKLPCKLVFENDRFIVFHDIAPKAPIHLLIVPKKPIKNLSYVSPEDCEMLGEVFLIAKQVAEEFGIEEDFRLLSNCGERAGQEIFHLHFHLVGGKILGPIC